MDISLLTEQIDRITAEFSDSFGALSPEQMNWKPSPVVWSVAQNIEHLILINESYYPMISAAFRKNYKPPFHARFDFLVKFMEKSVLASVQPNRKKKIKTFKLWEPQAGIVEGDILHRFIKHQTSLKQVLKNSKSLLEKGVIISSPANRNLVYRLEVVFQILLTHEKRHLNQAREILAEIESV